MKILLIDDHTLFRSGIETMLTSLEPKTNIQSYENCTNAVESISMPDDINLVLLDYHIPGSKAETNINIICRNFEHAKIVILSGETEPAKIIDAIDAGISGFIPKSSEPEVLIAALKLVLAGGVYLPPDVLRYQINAKSNDETSVSRQSLTNPLDALTKRQKEVFIHMVDGKSNKVIASEIGLALGTVKAHLSAAYHILGVSSRTEAVVLASKISNLRRIN